MQKNPTPISVKIGTLIFLFLLGLNLPQLMAEKYNLGYLDYLDSYYKTGNPSDLESAKNSIKTELDSSLALKIQGYYYNAEIEFLRAFEKLHEQTASGENIENLRNLLLELYDRYLENYYQIKQANLKNSNLEGNTAYLFKDIFLAATIMPGANSVAPLVKNLLRRAGQDRLFNSENSFVASVNDLFSYEDPNLFGMANLIKAVWTYDQFMAGTQSQAQKDSLRQIVSYHSAIAVDTLKSNFGKSVAGFLLATTSSNVDNDAAWTYFQKCLSLSQNDADFPKTGFYARNYNRGIYLATTVAFLPAYCEYLYDNGRYAEIMKATEYLADLGKLDVGMLENVSKEAIFWGEKSIRALQNDNRFGDSDDLYRRLQAFYKLLNSDEAYGAKSVE